MTRDPSDGSVKKKKAKLDLSFLPAPVESPERLAEKMREERSREWLKDYLERRKAMGVR